MGATNRLGAAGVATAAAACAGLWLSCSTPPPPDPPAWTVEQEVDPAPRATAVADVVVESRRGGTVVSLVGVGGVPYQSARAEDPERLLIDLPGAEVAGAPPLSPVFDGFVRNVAVVERPGAPPRVELTLDGAWPHEVVSRGAALEIRIGAPEPQAAAEDLAAPAGAAWDVAEAAVEDEPASSLELIPLEATRPREETPAAPAELPPATRLWRIDPEGGDSGTVVALVADGMLQGVESFTLEAPSRLVVDLPDLHSDVRSGAMPVGTAHVARVRVGQHADKVRVVIDAGPRRDAFAERQLQPTPNGLLVALGAGDRVTDALAEARAALRAPSGRVASIPSRRRGAPRGGGLPRVEAVEYVPGGAVDRVTVRGDRPLRYEVFEPDDATYVLIFKGATLAEEAAQQLVPQPGGAVSLVSAFAQPDLAAPEVRVVINRAAGLSPSLLQVENELVAGFERAAGTAGALPVLAGGGPSRSPGRAGSSGGAPGLAPTGGPLAGATGSGARVPAALAPASAPAAIDSAPAAALQTDGLLDGKSYAGRRISLDFKDVDVRDVLRLIADVSDLNVIAGDDVDGTVTIRLVDVPWDQALDVILLTKGLGFVKVGNVLRIAPSQLLKNEEEARLQERRAREKLEDLVLKLQPVNYADVGEVSGLIGRLLTSRGTVDVDERTSTLIIKDIPSVVEEAISLIESVDTQTPQVLIEARIVEASLDFSRQLGIEWGIGTSPPSADLQGEPQDPVNEDFTIGGQLPITRPGRGLPLHSPTNVVFQNPITADPTGIFNFGHRIFGNRAAVLLRIAALESSGEGKIISSPRVVTLDNREASIQQGVSIPFQTFENGDAQLEFVDAILELSVTPHITADRSIIMEIEVSRNGPNTRVDTPTGSPAIDKNEASTETLVKDGDTLVLGGIYTINRSEQISKTPWLADIPVLGHLFKRTRWQDERRELLIFVTPTIVEAQAAARIGAAAGG